MPTKRLFPKWLVPCLLGVFVLGLGVHSAVKGTLISGVNQSNQVTASSITDFTISIGTGDLSETLPFNTSPIRKVNGTYNVGAAVTFTITKPDATTVVYTQTVDVDGRIRGQIFNGIVNQLGTYNLSAQVAGGSSASTTFTIREKVLKAADDQTITGRRQVFRNSANDVNAFAIQNSGGTNLFLVDTVNNTVTITGLQGSGAGLTSLNAGSITSGTLADSRLSSNITQLGQTVESGEITDNTIVNADIAAAAAIAYSKLSLTGSVTNADIANAAAIAYSKLSLSNSVTDADIAAGANIADSKLATISTAGKVSDTALSGNVALLDRDSQTFTGSGNGTAVGNLFKNTADSTTAFAVQNVAGTNLIAVDTVSGAVTITGLQGSGANLTNLNASDITTGTLADGRLSANVSLLGQTVESAEISDGTITNGDINASAAIAYGKLSLTGALVNTDVSAGAAIAYSKLNLANSLVNADVAAGAAIAYSKLNLAGSVTDADIAAAAAIAYSKLNLTGSIVNADIAAGANIDDSKLATISTVGKVADTALSANVSLLGQTIESTEITNGTIVDADIAAGAAIDDAKLGTINDAGKVADSALSANVTLQGNTFNGANQLVQLNGSGALPTLNGANLTNVDAALLNGQAASYYTNATNISSGTLADARLSSNVALRDAAQTFTGSGNGTAVGNLFKNAVDSTTAFAIQDSFGTNLVAVDTTAGTVSIVGLQGSGASLTNLNATNVTSGTLADARLTANVSLLGQTVESAEITDNTITNADINAGAAIDYSKLALTGSIVNADVAAGAAIAYSKLNLATSIVNADINAAAAIAYSKLSLGNSVVNADIAAGAAIAYSKLNLSGSIVNADIAAGAAIADSKLATISTAGKVADSALSSNVALENTANVFTQTNTFSGQIVANGGGTGLAVANNATISGTLGVTGQLNANGGISTSSGDLSLNAAGSNINANSKNLTNVGTIGSGAITSNSTIQGTQVNGTTGIYTGASGGTQRVDSSGNLVNIGNITASGDIFSKGIGWTTRTSAADNGWSSVAYGNGLFVAVAYSGTGNRVMTSPDGVNWTTRTSAADNQWNSVAYGNGLFVAVAYSGTGNRVMTSPDGITWTSRTSAADNSWSSVTYGNGLFVAVASTGSGNRVMTSPDGVNWTTRTSAADNQWNSVAYGNGLFVAVAYSGTGNRVMTSPDGITWTSRTSAANNSWYAVTYGNGFFVAVAGTGTNNRVMTSPDGVNWTIRTSAADNSWYSVTYASGLFVAVSFDGTNNRVMTSPNGITWTTRTNSAEEAWAAVTYGNGILVAVAQSGAGNRVMTSGKTELNTLSTNNTFQGGTTVYGSSLFKSDANSATAFRIQNASGSSLFNVDTTGNGALTLGLNSSSTTTLNGSLTALNVNALPAAGTDNGLTTKVQGNGNFSFIVQGDGKAYWGDGTNPVDTDLYRGGFAQLKTSGEIWAVGQIKVGSGATAVLSNDAQGALELGPAVGSGNSPFIDLHYGTGSSEDYNIRIQNSADGTLVFRSADNGTFAQFDDDAGGAGLGGLELGTAGDTNLYRTGSGNLSTDDHLESADFSSDTYVRAHSPAGVSGANSVLLGWNGSGAAAMGPAVTFGTSQDITLFKSGTGAIAIRPSNSAGNSATAFQVQKADGTAVINVDNSNNILVVGTGTEKMSHSGGALAFNRNVGTGAIYNSAGHAYQWQHGAVSTTGTSDYLQLQVYNASGGNVTSNALVVNGAGNVGIGVSPASKLHVDGITQITDGTVSADTAGYATFGVTRPASASTLAYYALTRSGQYVHGLGIDSSNTFVMGPSTASTQIISPTFSLGSNGATLFKNSSNSAVAFQVQKNSGTTLLGIDTQDGNDRIFTTSANSATVVGFKFDTPAYTTAGAKLVSFRNNGTEKFAIDKNGHIITGGIGPTATVASGAGTGASCTVSGNDTSGTITLTTDEAGSGFMIGLQCTVTFNGAFSSTPRPVLSPTSGVAATVQPYVGATTTTLTLNFRIAATTGLVYTFNYFNPQ